MRALVSVGKSYGHKHRLLQHVSLPHRREVSSEESLLESGPHRDRDEEDLERIPEMPERGGQESNPRQRFLGIVVAEVEPLNQGKY